MICGVCGGENRPGFRAPPAELAPDLDLRPGEPTRSTLPKWLTTCQACGATAPDLALLSPDMRAVIDQPSYRTQKNPFLRWAALAPGDPEPWLQAAWLFDDRPDAEQAILARGHAADAWGTPADTSSALRLLDVLRRGHRFTDAAALAENLSREALDENSARIVAFQRARIAAGDDGRHLISSALRPPARNPHVAHGKPQKSFWGRLLGR